MKNARNAWISAPSPACSGPSFHGFEPNLPRLTRFNVWKLSLSCRFNGSANWPGRVVNWKHGYVSLKMNRIRRESVDLQTSYVLIFAKSILHFDPIIYFFSFSFFLKRCKRDVVINVYTFVRRNPKDRKRTMAFSIACICCTRTVSKPNHINYDSSYQFTNTKLRSTVFLKCTYYQSCTIGLLIDSRLNFISWGEGGRKKREIVRNIGR